jgi:hypothetical protein
MPGDLIEPEGVNAESAEAQRDDPPPADPRPGGRAAAGPGREPPPAEGSLGAPPEGDADDVYGSEPPA